jgi:hypothetical protein
MTVQPVRLSPHRCVRKLNNDDVQKALYQISGGQTDTDFKLLAFGGCYPDPTR